MSGPLRSIIPIALVLVAVVAVSGAVALMASRGGAEPYPGDSPEGTVQRYLQALQDRDLDRAYGMLSSRAQDETSREEFRRVTRFDIPTDRIRRVRLDYVETEEDRSLVQLTTEQVSGNGINFERYSYQFSVPLVREDGDWKIDDPFAVVASTDDGRVTG